ncbi:MAG: hypothetical protein PHU44_08205 [Syntrophales bacterium]|nr:hypothetical protein [Syntrophales bacterium]MDD5641788.1 hypothetical protein [Syntrophales bacterium]
MEKKLLCFILFLGLIGGCVTAGTSVRQGRELYSTVNVTNLQQYEGVENELVFNPTEVESELPQLGDLPYPAPLKKERRARKYTGIIKNKTQYEVTVPAGNSSATLVIPAHGFIEYTAWARHFNLTAYRDGKPFYCMQINANPRTYPYMCKKYDFLIEIVKAKPIKKKYRKKRKKRPGGVEAYG